MPVTIKKGEFKYKDPDSGEYKSVDAISEGTTDEYVNKIVAKGEETLEIIPEDYTSLNTAVRQIGNDLNEQNIYAAGSEAGYITGLDSTTSIYFLVKGTSPLVIPKGSTIAKIRFINSSTYHHSICLYCFERLGWNFKLIRKVSGLSIDNGNFLEINMGPFETDVYIAIRNEVAYGIKIVDGDVSDRSTGSLIMYSNSEPDIGDIITPTRVDSQKRAYNVDVSIFATKNRECDNYTGNNTFLFKNKDIVSEIQWLEGKAFSNSSFDASTTIDNYQFFLSESSVGDTSRPIPIRDNSGNLINNIVSSSTQSYSEAFLVSEFDRYGVYIRTLTAGDFTSDGFSSDCYFAVMRRFTNYDTRYFVENSYIAWLSAVGEEYTVGENGDFLTFTEMLIALKDNMNQKTVYVTEGVYDIYEEMGGDAYLATITNPESLNWRDVCHVVPDNTTIIGIGKVVLTWEPSASAVGSNAMAFLFSPLNLSGSATVENIEIHCTNCRYAIHDETSSLPRWNNVNRKLKNIHAVHTKGTYHSTEQTYGAGIAPTGIYDFENCIFENDANWFIFSMHATNMALYDKTTVNIKNCIIRNTDSMTIRSSDSPVMGFGSVSQEQKYIDVNINGCWLAGNIRKYPEGDAQNIMNAYGLTLIGNNALEVQDTNATNNRPVIKCNEFANN